MFSFGGVVASATEEENAKIILSLKMKNFKIVLHVLAIFFGGIMSLFSISNLFKSFNRLTEATGLENVSASITYLFLTLIFGWLFVWIFWQGISFFTKKQQLTEADIEKKIDDIDK